MHTMRHWREGRESRDGRWEKEKEIEGGGEENERIRGCYNYCTYHLEGVLLRSGANEK